VVCRDGSASMSSVLRDVSAAAPSPAERYQATRAKTVALAQALSAEDCAVQSMPEASPIKWHLGHTTWFFETFVLEPWQSRFRPFDGAFRVLFNSYYNAVGEKHPRAQRGLLTRPSLEAVLAYRADVDRRMAILFEDCVDAGVFPEGFAALVELGLNHEEQHQELILTDILHLFSLNPLLPVYGTPPDVPARARALEWLEFPGGVTEIGHAGGTFCFDNESPRHSIYLQPYRLASRLTSNAEYAGFIAAGGYGDPQYWLSDGWDWRTTHSRTHPLYWRQGESGWQEFTLGGLIALDAHRAVSHISYYEADAYARWAGARLPTEGEWENAASRAGSMEARGGVRLVDLTGALWQWTASSYSPYPGFRPGPSAIGEYNGKFMVNQYVLRGGSRATPNGHTRLTYRNFFAAPACWQFSGIRLAQSD
jgi:ergothioneine biosynthesis protein EgtB